LSYKRNIERIKTRLAIISKKTSGRNCMKTIQGRFRAAVLMASVLAFAIAVPAQNQNFNGNGGPNSNNNTWPYAATSRSAPVLAVVGDVACQPGETEPSGESAKENCVGDTAQNLFASQAATAKQIENMKPDLVALVGDEQYQVG
jgi:hypothetical protein